MPSPTHGERRADVSDSLRRLRRATARSRRRRTRAAREAARARQTTAPRGSDTAATRRETALDGTEHFVDLDVEQAHRVEPAAAQMMALADRRRATPSRRPATRARCARGASARRCRRSACRPPRRYASDRCRPTPAPRRRGRARPGRQWRSAVTAPRRRPRAPQPRRPARRSPGPHKTTDIRPMPLASAAATAAETRRGPALVGPRRAGIQQRITPAGPLAHLRARRRVHRARWETPACRPVMPSGCEQTRG